MTARHRLKIPERRGPRKQPWLRGPQKRTAVSFSWLWRPFSASVTCVCRHPDCFQLLYPLNLGRTGQSLPACIDTVSLPMVFPLGNLSPTLFYLWPSQIWLSACLPASSSSVNLLITIGLSMVFSPKVRNSVIMNYHRIINERKINIVKNSATNEVCGKFLV